MTDSNQNTASGQGGRPKWFFLAALAMAFSLSFLVGELMGPVGAMLGLGLGAVVAWAAAKWMYPVKGAEE
ncbi:MAG: hypothetical protein QNI90_09700 [Dinoroseobacter sp.]|nr:hypothetical protein [Dinoroseobacter sp.]